MDLNAASIRLGLLSKEDVAQVSQIKPSCLCQFLWKDFEDPLQAEPEKVSIQLRDNFLIQVNTSLNTIISGFQCDYQINFEIIRTASDVIFQVIQVPGKLGVPQTLDFIFVKENNRRVSLIVQDVESTQKFCKKLQKQYIVQLGFRECFKAIKVLGKGVTATVYKAIRYRDQKDVAIKSFKRSVYFNNQNGKQSFQKQFKILSQLSHKNICQLEGVYETQNSTYIVMQHLELSLFAWIQKYGFPNYLNAKKMMYQMFNGINYLHYKGIMHRDLKLENIMIRRDSKQNVQVVIVDLGLAQFTDSVKFLFTRCGTPGYVAPEILKTKSNQGQKYNEACDIFSLGVIFHILFFKKSIFEGTQVKQVIKKNTQCNIDFKQQYFNSIEKQGLELLQRMLQKDPKKRITALEAINHEFFKQVSNCGSASLLINCNTSISIGINNYS